MDIVGPSPPELYFAEAQTKPPVLPAARKQTLRRLALARRARLSPEERTARGSALIERLLELPEIGAATSVLAFVSISTEVPTEPLLRAILASGKRLLLPFVADDGSMKAAAIASLDELEPGYRGIPEPASREPVPATAADAIVLPGVAFDERGGRLGYGGGFYDRFLSAASGRPLIGICFEAQLVDEVPMLEHDRRVDVVVTEGRTIRAS